MGRFLTLSAALALALSLAACGGEAADTATGETSAESAEAPSAQTFEGAGCSAEYQGTQDVTGNAMVTFYLTNGTESTLLVSSDALVVNGEYSVTSLGGSVAPIQPGTTGSVSLVFGVSVQTPLEGTDAMEGLRGELVLMDNDSYDEVGRIPFDVAI